MLNAKKPEAGSVPHLPSDYAAGVYPLLAYPGKKEGDPASQASEESPIQIQFGKPTSGLAKVVVVLGALPWIVFFGLLQAAQQGASARLKAVLGFMSRIFPGRPWGIWRKALVGLCAALFLLATASLVWYLRPAADQPIIEPLIGTAEDWQKLQDEISTKPSPLDNLDPRQIPHEEYFDGQPEELVAIIGTGRGRHWDDIACLAVSPDGHRIASGGWDGMVLLWEADTLRQLAALDGHTAPVEKVVFAPDGKFVASSSINEVILWDVAGEKPGIRATLEGESEIRSLALAPNGKLLAVGERMPTIIGWPWSDWSDQGAVRLWDLQGQVPTERAVLGAPTDSLTSLVFTPDSRVILGAGGKRKTLFDRFTRIVVSDITPKWEGEDGKTFMWDLADLPPERNRVTRLIHSVFFSRQSKNLYIFLTLLAIGLLDAAGRAIATWCIKDAKKTCLIYMESIGLSWIQVGTGLVILFVCLPVGLFRFWYGSTIPISARLEFPGSEGVAHVIAVSPDGTMLATGTFDHFVRLWKMTGDGPKLCNSSEGHAGPIHALAFGRDGQTLFSASEDKTIRIWGLANDTLKERGLLAGHEHPLVSVAPIPESNTLVSACDHVVCRWQGKDGEFALSPPPSENGIKASLAVISADGKTLAATGFDNKVRLWDMTGSIPKLRATLEGHKDRVVMLRFSSNGKLLFSGSLDNTSRLWDLTERNPKLLTTKTGFPQEMSERWLSSDFRFKANWEGHRLDGIRLERFEPAWDLDENKPSGDIVIQADTDAVKYFCFAADGKTIGIVGETKGELWERTGSVTKRLGSFEGYKGRPDCLTFSPDGKNLVLRTKCSDPGKYGTIKCALWLWEVKGDRINALPSIWSIGRGVCCETFALDGRVLIGVEGRSKLVLWETATGKRLRDWQFPGEIDYMDVAPDGRHLIVVNANGTVYVLRLFPHDQYSQTLAEFDEKVRQGIRDTGALLGRGQLYMQSVNANRSAKSRPGAIRSIDGNSAPISSVAALPDQSCILSTASDGTIRLWAFDAGHEDRTISDGVLEQIQTAAVTPSGQQILSGGSDHSLCLRDLQTGKAIHRFQGHTDVITDVAIAADGKRALSGSADGTARLWEIATGKELAVFHDHDGRIRCVALSPDGRVAAVGGEDGLVSLWDLAAVQKKRTLTAHQGGVHRLVFAADSRRLLTGGADHTLRLWDTGTGLELRCFTGHTEAVECVALSSNAKLALSGCRDGTIRLWDVATGETLHTFKGHTGPVTAIAFSPDDRSALSGGQDKAVRLWRLPLTFAQAISDFTAALQLKPDAPAVYVLRGTCYFQKGHVAEALADCNQAVNLDRQCGDAYFLRGLIQASLGESARAVADFSEVVRLDPEHALAYYHRGLLYADKEDYARAKADLEKALQLDPELGKK